MKHRISFHRHLLALVLVAYLMAVSAPFLALADDSTTSDAEKLLNFMCTLPSSIDPYTLESADGNKTQDEAYQTWQESYESAYTGIYDAANCGVQVNGTTQYLEKGDCTATSDEYPKGRVITEITEPIAPTTTLDENTKVVTVYAGICCLGTAPDEDGTYVCDDTRTVYSLSYSACTVSATNCQERQWLIASSGIGLLKLFVKQIYTWGALAVGSVAVGTIIFNGVKISVAGVSGDISDAKTKIYQAIAGIALLFLSSLILYTINPDFFG